MKIAAFFALLFWSLFWGFAAQAQETAYYPRPAKYEPINDFAALLQAEAIRDVRDSLIAFEKRTGTQIVVMIVPTLYAKSVEEFALTMYNSWQIGSKERNNGALLVIAPTERKMRIEVGYGLEGLLTDAACRRIIEEVLAPAFKQEKYADGIRAAVWQMISLSDVAELARPNALLRFPLSENYFLRVLMALGLMAIFLRGHWLLWAQKAVAAALLCLLYDRAFFINPLFGEDTPQGLAALFGLLVVSFSALPIIMYRKSTGASSKDEPIGFFSAYAYMAVGYAFAQLLGLAFRTSLGEFITSSIFFGAWAWQYRRSVIDAEALKRHKKLPALFASDFALYLAMWLSLGAVILFIFGIFWAYFEHFVAYGLWLGLFLLFIDGTMATVPSPKSKPSGKTKQTYGGSSKNKKKGKGGAAVSSYSDYKDYSDYSDSYSDTKSSYSDYSDSYSDSSWGGGSSGGGGASGSW